MNEREKRNEINEEYSDNILLSSNNSFYDKLDLEIKKDIIFLIKSGYDKKIIIKLYIFAKPLDINQAIDYLTKENGIYQHSFYNFSINDEYCEICGEKKEMHININNDSTNILLDNIQLNINVNTENEINTDIIKNEEEIENKCKICEDEISEEEKIKNKCEQCNNYFCSECLYLYIKESIRNGKHLLVCPNCSFIYTKDKIEQILSFNIENIEEVNNLRKLLEKSSTKEIILSDPELMFCPIPDCNGFAKKNSNKEFNICTMGHKFCNKCGELWHKNSICKEEENVDKYFGEYRKKYNLKNCPYCNIITNKNGGCNHITCKYCGKDWCWLCQKIFISTEEHYGNVNSACYGRMEANQEQDIRLICSKCENVRNINRRNFSCGHFICDNCFNENLLESKTMIILPVKLLNCIIPQCSGYKIIYGINLSNYIKESNNERLINKYKYSILFLIYALIPYSKFEYGKYLHIYVVFMDLINSIFRCLPRGKFYKILSIIGMLLGIVCFPVFILIIPIFFHLAIKDLYYCIFLPEIRKEKCNKILIFLIFVSEEILFLIFLFALIACHYIYSLLFLPLYLLSLLFRKIIYGAPICSNYNYDI